MTCRVVRGGDLYRNGENDARAVHCDEVRQSQPRSLCARSSWEQGGKRRRWELNPPRAALQAAATPCDIGVNRRFSLRFVSVLQRVNLEKCPCQESNLVHDLRRVACLRHTPRTFLHTGNSFCTQVPRRGFEPRPTVSKTVMPPPHSQGDSKVVDPGVEPDPAASETAVLPPDSSTLLPAESKGFEPSSPEGEPH